MDDGLKTRKELVLELESLRRRVSELERCESRLLEVGTEIREVKSRILDTLESISDAFFSLNDDLVVTYFNHAAEILLGRDRNDILGRNLFDAFPEARNSVFEEVYTQAVKHKEGTVFEAYFDRSPYVNWYEVRVYPQKKGISVYFQVITERKNREEALRESEAKFRAIADYSFDWENWVSPDGKLMWVNPAVERISGYSPEECYAMENFPFPLIYEEDRKALGRFYQQAVSGTSGRDLEFRIIKKDGSLSWCSVSWQPIYDSEGISLGHRSSVRDIGEQKKNQEELRRTRNFLGNIIDSIPSIIAGMDAEGRITRWNARAAQISGISPQQAKGLYIAQVLPMLSDVIKAMKAAVVSKTPMRYGKKPFKQKELTAFYDIMLYPLAGDDVEGAVVRIDDITERVFMEEMMVQTEKMMTVGGLAAGMAHEINNPLGGILQGAQIIQRRIAPDVEKNIKTAEELGVGLEVIRAYLEKREIIKYIGGIREMGERAAKIVVNMLNFSRRSESKISLQDINLLLDKTVELAANDYDLKKKYDFKRIRIVKEFQADLPQVPCAQTEIEQVMINLLKNAAHAASGNPPDRPPRIILRTFREDRWLRLEVEDNGKGMDEFTRMHAFEPFFTTKPVGLGTGLGLSVSYFIIVTNHKGSITVESEMDKGAKFIIRLPIVR